MKGREVLRAEETDHPNARVPNPIKAQDFTVMPGHGTKRAVPVIVSVPENAALTVAQKQYLTSQGVQALLSAPLILNEEMLGALTDSGSCSRKSRTAASPVPPWATTVAH